MKLHSSVTIAKKRLQVLLVSDRVNCTPDNITKLNQELYKTISKYIEVNPHDFHVRISNSDIYITLTGDNY